MHKYEQLSTEELSDYYSDYYKEVHGVRNRYVDSNNREQLLESIKSLDKYMDSLKATVEGRNELRDNGWIIKEPSAEEDGWVNPWTDKDFNPF